jgi:hypothetical protein
MSKTCGAAACGAAKRTAAESRVSMG